MKFPVNFPVSREFGVENLELACLKRIEIQPVV
jgi:hypothetical protein